MRISETMHAVPNAELNFIFAGRIHGGLREPGLGSNRSKLRWWLRRQSWQPKESSLSAISTCQRTPRSSPVRCMSSGPTELSTSGSYSATGILKKHCQEFAPPLHPNPTLEPANHSACPSSNPKFPPSGAPSWRR